MRVVHLAEDPIEASYVVATPRRGDALGLTLRAAYHATDDDADPFADMLAILNTIESVQIAR